MAKIKSFTDISQSKVLAKFLPLESADMVWISIDDDESFDGSWEALPKTSSLIAKDDNQISCWSLAALLSVLPKNLNIGRPSLESNYKGYYWIQYYDEFMNPNNYKTECFCNPVDACYEMILKLHKLNLL